MMVQWNLDITKGPKDWQNVFSISTARFRYIKVLNLFIYFAITRVKNIVCFSRNLLYLGSTVVEIKKEH